MCYIVWFGGTNIYFWQKSAKRSTFLVIHLQFHEKNDISITVHKEGIVLITLHAVESDHEAQRKTVGTTTL